MFGSNVDEGFLIGYVTNEHAYRFSTKPPIVLRPWLLTPFLEK
jgi:hypothetical protein